MADTVYFKDGTAAVLLSESDFVAAIRERLGDDAADRIARLQEDAEDANETAAEALNTDLANYENSLERDRRAFCDALEELATLEHHLSVPRINRNKALSAAARIKAIMTQRI